MTQNSALLENRALIHINGANVFSFLQGLLTCDMSKVSNTQAQAGALLSPQGKILFDLFVIACEDSYLIETALTQRDAFIKRLQFYKLRAAVAMTSVNNLRIFALWGDTIGAGFPDPRWPPLGNRLYAESFKTSDAPEAYEAHRISQAVPEAEKDYILGDTFPHEANYDLLNGVDFDKGCYVGQEVVSRMQHKGSQRKRIIGFNIEGKVNSGTEIIAGTIAIGKIGSVAGQKALAMTRLDRLEEAIAAGHSLSAGTAILHPLKPPWANFKI